MTTKTARLARAALVALTAFAATAFASAANTPAPPLVVDLTDFRGGSIYAWLQAKGFHIEQDAKNPQKIALMADTRGLGLQTLRPALGLLTNTRLNPNAYSTVEIEWGVAQHPAGASYERRVNNEAIMVHVFFGAAKRSSGSLFAPNLPPFIGLFLCATDRVGFPYVGRHYQEAGRYICVDRAEPERALTTRFDLRQGFRTAFGADLRDAVSGFAVAVDTSSSKGPSQAFVKRITFLP
ncbi:MAG: hypothetical protein HOP13_19795 [Alphaproteobacteria bacterium]|nr:hypothetical protein [Alphaproteobacteria bacterium]